MESREQRPRGGVTLHITLGDRRGVKAIGWYKQACGAEAVARRASDDERLMHAHLRINGGASMLHDDFPEHMGGPSPPPACLVLHLDVPNADAACKRALDA